MKIGQVGVMWFCEIDRTLAVHVRSASVSHVKRMGVKADLLIFSKEDDLSERELREMKDLNENIRYVQKSSVVLRQHIFVGCLPEKDVIKEKGVEQWEWLHWI